LELGMSATMVTSFSGRRSTLFTKIGWGHDYLRDMTFAATLTGVPRAGFVVAGARQDRDIGLVAAGCEYKLTPNAVLCSRFDSSASASSRSYACSGSMRMSF
jgi:outer membrane autotransporter protein